MKCSWQVYSLLLCGSVMIGCGESTDSTVSDSAPAAAPATATAPVEKAPSDPLLEGIEFDDPEEFPKALSAYEAAPTDVAAVEKYSQVLLSMAWAHAQGENAELSNEAITRAGKIILKANADGVALPVAPESMLQAEILFGYACVQSTQKKGTESLETLKAAVKSGFSNLDLLKNDKDLEFTRTLPEFETQIAAWEAAHEAEVIATAKADLKKGETFPFDFQLTDVNGKEIQLGSYKLGKSRHPEGQICVVDIWGTWCPPCRQEVPMFIKLQEKYGKFGLQMIGLNDERGLSPEANVSTVKNFMANTSMNYPCAIITPEVMEQVPEFKGFPTTLFIDHHGKVRHMAFGFHEYKYMETIVETLLSERTREARTAATN